MTFDGDSGTRQAAIHFIDTTVPAGEKLRLAVRPSERIQILDVRQIGPDLNYRLVVIRDA